MITIGKQKYHKIGGIAQGAILGSIYSSIYLNHIENEAIRNFQLNYNSKIIKINEIINIENDEVFVLLRRVDDFLIIANDKKQIIIFLKYLFQSFFISI